jgi:hypothetical protein
MLPDFTWWSAQLPDRWSKSMTYRLAVDDSGDLERERSFHLLDGLLESFSVSRAGAVAPLSRVSSVLRAAR